ncbi:hypothetical protein LCL96_14050 [Rossellomorea aquimaris]|nr:hypothetical protein [Rossellomorea aquimaris]MCA1060056.1 hypothetical protein [Rossellomorea aquimaris]
METFVIVVVIVLSLWSITITIEKQTEKMLESHREQIDLLKKIQSKLDEK